MVMGEPVFCSGGVWELHKGPVYMQLVESWLSSGGKQAVLHIYFIWVRLCVFLFFFLNPFTFWRKLWLEDYNWLPQVCFRAQRVRLKTVSVTYKNIDFLAQISLMLATGQMESQNYKERCSQVSYYHGLFPRKNHKIE